MLADLVSLATCLTGIILILFSDLEFNGYTHHESDRDKDDGEFGQQRISKAAIYILAGVV